MDLAVVDVIQFVTISILGNAQDFGNLTGAKQEVLLLIIQECFRLEEILPLI